MHEAHNNPTRGRKQGRHESNTRPQKKVVEKKRAENVCKENGTDPKGGEGIGRSLEKKDWTNRVVFSTYEERDHISSTTKKRRKRKSLSRRGNKL